MDAAFWLERWATHQIGFHEPQPHAQLRAHFPRLGLAAGAPVFVPLCGKSHDLAWLHAAGHAVCGVELSAIALDEFFAERGLEPRRHAAGALTCYESPGYRLYQGDFFALASGALGSCAAIYDRAALIALPPAMRIAYARHLSELAAPGTAMLLITVGYDPAQVKPPPFVVDPAEVETLYGAAWTIDQLATVTAAVKGAPGTETVYQLLKR
ncbi:MAG: thiopurine S-methyltransferase [Gammaproteobacteria bacterium]|nr:thiopurine S-methyltransferase [Gammaproteobacteria bacterium]